MAGLLDFIQSPGGQGLLSAAFGGLAGARRGAPLNSLGRAGLAGLAGYAGAQDRQAEEARAAQQQQIFDMRTTELRDSQAAKKKQQDYFQTLNPSASSRNAALMGGGGPTVENAAKIQPVDPRKQQMWELAANGVIPVSDYIKNEVMPETPDYKVVGNSLVSIGRNGVKEAYRPEEKIDPNKPFMYQNGQIIANPAYQQFELEKASRGAARTNVRVDAGPKAFWQDFGKSASEQLFQERDAAKAASGTLQSVDEIRKAAAGGAYQGAGAEMKLNAAKALGALGMPYDAKTVANSELFNAQANQFVLNSIKGLGANPSNADREFIEKTVPRLSTDPKALPELLNFIETKARGQIGVYNSKIKGVQQQAEGGFIPYSLEVPVPETSPAPAAPKQQTFDMLPPASRFTGRRMQAPDGTIYKSDGKKWVKG